MVEKGPVRGGSHAEWSVSLLLYIESNFPFNFVACGSIYSTSKIAKSIQGRQSPPRVPNLCQKQLKSAESYGLGLKDKERVNSFIRL